MNELGRFIKKSITTNYLNFYSNMPLSYNDVINEECIVFNHNK